MAEDSVVVTLVNQVSEDQEAPLGLVGVEEHHALEDEVVYHAESASEGDVEVDNVMLDAGEDGNSGSMTNITFDVRKRTLIMMWQRTILEEFYRAGMTSASMQLQSLHLDAAEKTGLDNTVIKNWIRNRRRPAAMKSAERLAERINQGDVIYNQPSIPSQSSPVTTSPTNTTPMPCPPSSSNHAHYHVYSGNPPVVGASVGHMARVSAPEAKRPCLEPASARVSSSFPHPSLAIPSPTITTTTHQPLQLPPSFLSPTSFLVKIRVCNSGETDFYEIELPSLTYKCLLKSCAEELEVDVALIYKIRKLPNILLRRDRDVQRLKEGQELEVVIREAPAMSMNPLSLSGGYGSSSNGLSIMNLPLQGDPSSLTISPSLGLHPTSHVNGLH